MKNKIVKILTYILIFNMFFLWGCWDSRELDQLYIVGSSAIDLTEDDEYKFTLQIVKTQETSTSNSQGQQSSGMTSPLVLSAVNKSIIGAFMTINENCSRGLLFDHNQVMLFGQAVAEKGIENILDVFIRVQEARIEVPIVIVEDDIGAKVLITQIEENSLSGQFVNKIFEGLSVVSKYYKMRIIDVVKNLLSESHATTIPMVKIVKKEGKDVVEFAGFALLKNGVIVGKLNQEQVKGFVFAKDNVKTLIFNSETQNGIAGYRALFTKSKIDVKLVDENQIEVSIDVKGDLELDELNGFIGIEPKELVKALKESATEELERLINQAITISQNANCDIFGVANKIWKKIQIFGAKLKMIGTIYTHKLYLMSILQ